MKMQSSDLKRFARFSLVTIAAACFAQTNVPTASVGSVPASRIISPSPTYSFPDGETFVYSVEWHLLNAGTATVKLQHSNSGEHLSATADSAGIVNTLYRVHDIFDADLDPRTFCTLQISKHSEEGSRKLERKIQFDYSRAKSETDDKDLKTGQWKHAEHDLPACVTDVISGFFYAGSLPLDPGFSHMFPVNDGGKTADIRIQAESHEKVKAPFGTFQTVKVQAEAISGPLQGKGVIWVWFSDDARHVPVQMKSKLGFATLLFRLQRIDGQPSGR
jgi:uncharacterized protein DUF3108